MPPVHRSAVPRRRLLDLLLGGHLFALVAAIAWPIVRFVFPSDGGVGEPARVRVGPASDLGPGAYRIVRLGSRPIIVFRDPAGELAGFSAACTHLQCTVQYRPDMGQIWCACHDGRYDLAGRNVGGPPPRPLARYRVEVQDGDVFVLRA
jgi:Rieske Fe-S protein